MKICFNGKLVNKEEAKVSVFDHGYLYGDGVFEGIRAYSCVVFRLKEHIDRLYESAHSLMLNIPITKKQMIADIIKTLKANKLKDSYIRLVISRGDGDLGLSPAKCTKGPNIVIIADSITLYPKELYDNGMSIITVPTVRNVSEAVNPQIKSLNYLNNILAKIEAANSGYEEALMLNREGYIVECTGDNIFMVKNGILITPFASMGALKGVTRDAVMDIAAKLKIKVVEKAFTRHEIYNADECFLTGTAAEVIPVVKIDNRAIAEAKPGKITKAILKEFKRITKLQGEKYTI
ncbi:MAG: branched-chain-amino-acid transaminase [Candidatus Omnitrophica bacterium]|nr:branched-chain-amino-acid transaminase [Candidatus Omnitrophota bacterium]MDD5081115.1 branched-chain-amino-acid transaminase [Candidatus Omnitrophota bacterium]MDD5441642.1 branched-chain-amino-acid transaminase [Candidatus Omnitrophota bacterium]